MTDRIIPTEPPLSVLRDARSRLLDRARHWIERTPFGLRMVDARRCRLTRDIVVLAQRDRPEGQRPFWTCVYMATDYVIRTQTEADARADFDRQTLPADGDETFFQILGYSS